MANNNDKWDDVSKLEVQSETKLEQDTGRGKSVVIRCFEFAANPEAFKQRKPSKQELIESHRKGIEIMLWRDGLRPIEGAAVRIIVNKKKTKYRIFVGAEPSLGNVLLEQTKTLSQLAHGTRDN